jgi:hypothetical protein
MSSRPFRGRAFLGDRFHPIPRLFGQSQKRVRIFQISFYIQARLLEAVSFRCRVNLLDPIELAEQRAQVLGASTVQLTFGGGECRLFSCGLLSVGRDGVVGNAKIVRGVQEFAEQPIGFEQLMPQSVTAWSRPR